MTSTPVPNPPIKPQDLPRDPPVKSKPTTIDLPNPVPSVDADN